jgi:hypothetical protein
MSARRVRQPGCRFYGLVLGGNRESGSRAPALRDVGAPTKSNFSSGFMPLPGGMRPALPNKSGFNLPLRNLGDQVAS